MKAGTEEMKRKMMERRNVKGLEKGRNQGRLQISSLGTLKKVLVWGNTDKCNVGHVEFDVCGTLR